MIDPNHLRSMENDLLRIAGELAAIGSTRERREILVVPAGAIRDVIRSRRLRARMFPEGLFADPAWDMLLELSAQQTEGRTASVTGLCTASALAPTTGMRWIATLETHGLIEREADPFDGRKMNVRLSQLGLQCVSNYFAEVREADIPIA